jgi:hypothetical protein
LKKNVLTLVGKRFFGQVSLIDSGNNGIVRDKNRFYLLGLTITAIEIQSNPGVWLQHNQVNNEIRDWGLRQAAFICDSFSKKPGLMCVTFLSSLFYLLKYHKIP